MEPDTPSGPPPEPSTELDQSPWVFSYWQLVNEHLQHFEFPWSDEAGHFDRLLRTLHCRRQFALGSREAGLWVEVFRNERTTTELRFQFLATLNTPNAFDIILVHDLPDLLAFLEHLAPILRLALETGSHDPATPHAAV
jgi:hypothetical protein